MFANAPSRKFDLRHLVSLAATPAFIVFLSSNFVNVGNLAFNMIFSRLMGPELFGVLALLLTIKLALLGVMGAAQMAVSQVVASASREEAPKVEQALSRINRFLFAGLFLLGIPLTASFLLVGTVDARLELPATHLIVLLLAQPVEQAKPMNANGPFLSAAHLRSFPHTAPFWMSVLLPGVAFYAALHLAE